MATAAPTSLNPNEQIKNVLVYDDQLPANSSLEVTGSAIEDNIHAIISQLNRIINSTVSGNNWWNPLLAPSALDAGTIRGVNDLNDGLHLIERKRILKRVSMVGVDVSIASAGDRYVILGAADIPSTTTAAVGTVTTNGTVVAQATTFGTASAADVVTGANALQPKNLLILTDNSTGDVVTRGDGRQIYGLLQSENGTDGFTISGTTPNRVQISFVVHNSTNDDIELITSGDMDGITFDYAYVRRDAFEDCPEEAWLGDGFADTGVAASTRQAAYDNQGAAVVTTTTNAILDVGAGLSWSLRNNLMSPMFTASSAGLSSVTIGTVNDYDNNAIDVNFDNGITVDNGSNAINLGITANQIDFTGNATVTSTSGSTMTVTSDSANLNLSTTTSGNVVVNSANVVNIDGTSVDIDSSVAGISLDAVGNSNFTVDGADLTLSTTTSGEVDITSAGLMDINAGANLDVDVVGTMDFGSTSTFSIDGVGASNVTADSGNLTLSTTTSGDVVVSSANDVDMDASDVFVDATAGVSIDSGATSNFTVSSGDLNLGATTGELDMIGSTASLATTGGNLTINSSDDLFARSTDGSVLIGTASVYDLNGTNPATPVFLETSRPYLDNGNEGNLFQVFGVGRTTTGSGTTSGQVYIVDLDATTDTVAVGGFTAGVPATSDATVETTGSGTFAAGDYILIADQAGQDSRNRGIYQVDDHTGNTLTIKGPLTAPDAGLEWMSQQFATDATTGATIAKVTISILRTNASGQLQIVENINNGAPTFQDVGTGAVTLDNAIDNQGATPTTTGNDVIIGFTGTNSWEFRDSTGSQIAEAFSDGAGGEFEIGAALLDINAAAVEIDSTSISLDATSASNFTATGANLTLSTTGAGNTVVSSDDVAVLGTADTTGLEMAAVTSEGVSAAAAALTGFFDGLATDTNSAPVLMASGTVSGTGISGTATLTSGSGAAATGDVAVASGDSSGGQSGDLALSSGDNTGGTIANSGAVTISSGSHGASIGGQSGNVTLSSGSSTNANSGDLSLTSGAATSGVSGDISLTTGNSGSGIGSSGAFSFTSGSNTGSTGAATFTTGTVSSSGTAGGFTVSIGNSIDNTVDSNSAGIILLDAGDNAGSRRAGDITLDAGDNTGSGAGGDVQVFAGTSTSDAGGSITLTAAAGNTTGGSITLIPGAGSLAGSGVVGVDSALGLSTPVFRLDRADGTSGVTIDIFNGSVAPETNVTANQGDLYFRDGGANGNEVVYVKATGDANATGWEALQTASSAVTRKFFQTTMTSQVTPGNPITSADIAGTLPTKPTSGFNFDTDAEIYLNGILLFNGASNEVSSGTGDNINVNNGATFNVNDVLTIIYYTNSN